MSALVHARVADQLTQLNLRRVAVPDQHGTGLSNGINKFHREQSVNNSFPNTK
jgi:hypothetical protein